MNAEVQAETRDIGSATLGCLGGGVEMLTRFVQWVRAPDQNCSTRLKAVVREEHG